MCTHNLCFEIVGTQLNRLTEAVLMCTHNLCFEQKLENITIFHLNYKHFTDVKYRSILHGRVHVMTKLQYAFSGVHCQFIQGH